MADVIFTVQKDCKIRVPFFKVWNNGNKQIDWNVAAITLNADGSVSSKPIYEETINDPIDATLLSKTPAAGTVVDLAPGVSIDVSGIPMAVAAALLQWYGEQLCEARRPAIIAAITGPAQP